MPTAAIFTLIVGHGEGSFIGGYAGLTLLGAAVGVAVTAVFPPLPLVPVRYAIRSLRETLAADIDNLTAALTAGSPAPSGEPFATRVRQARAVLNHGLELAFEARRGHLRRHRYDRSIRELADSATRLEQLSIVVADLRNLLLHDQFTPTSPTPRCSWGRNGEHQPSTFCAILPLRCVPVSRTEPRPAAPSTSLWLSSTPPGRANPPVPRPPTSFAAPSC